METKDFNNEATELVNGVNAGTASSETTASEVQKRSSFSKGSAAVGAGFGILLGSTATFLPSCSTNAAAAETSGGSTTPSSTAETQPEWSDGEVAISSGVNDDMTFSEAFASARAESGPGAAFEWHGNVYGTYTAEEWDAMTPEERQEFQNHFSWSHSEVPVNDGNVIAADPAEVIDDVEVVDTSEVEILGVVQDAETGVSFGFMNIDGQDVVLADIDNDGEFDVMAADVDGNGDITPDEMVSVADAHVHVSDFSSSSVGTDSMYAMNDGTPDYVNDAGGFDNLA